MNLEKLLSDISEIKQKDFDFRHAYTCRETGKSLRLWAQPLTDVLPIARVCLTGHLMSKHGFRDTTGIHTEYDITREQLDCIIYPNSTIKFNSGKVIQTPSKSARLSTVLKFVKEVTSNQEWLNHEINYVDSSNSGCY